MEKVLNNKYKNPTDTQNYKMGKIYLKKLCTNFFKFLYYLGLSTFGYMILKDLHFFPVSLGGSGTISTVFTSYTYPNMFFWAKPDLFNIYYLGQLSFCITDLIWLVFIYEFQTDFLMMLLHHVCTISLILFSYVTNFSQIGCIILFLHDFGDIFVYFTRIVINTNVKSIYSVLAGSTLLVVFIYTRLYVFAEGILALANYSMTPNNPWHEVPIVLCTFLTFLYILHLNWVYLILRKIFNAIFKNDVADVYKVKQVDKSS
jgi:hypothetical protein